VYRSWCQQVRLEGIVPRVARRDSPMRCRRSAAARTHGRASLSRGRVLRYAAVHRHTRLEGVARLLALVHTPKVDPGLRPDPPIGEPSSSVSPEGRCPCAGLLLFHRAIRRLHAARCPGTVFPGYAQCSQCQGGSRSCSALAVDGIPRCQPPGRGNRFANTVPTRAIFVDLRKGAKSLIGLVSAEGLEPTTP
jgi:hypothetical protein